MELLRKLPRLGPVDLKIVMSDIYEAKYGIFDHRGVSQLRPLSSVAFHPCEDINTGSMLESLHRLYIDKRIREHYGLTIDEYLDRPRDVIEMMNAIADTHNARHKQHSAAVEAQLGELEKART